MMNETSTEDDMSFDEVAKEVAERLEREKNTLSNIEDDLEIESDDDDDLETYLHKLIDLGLQCITVERANSILKILALYDHNNDKIANLASTYIKELRRSHFVFAESLIFAVLLLLTIWKPFKYLLFSITIVWWIEDIARFITEKAFYCRSLETDVLDRLDAGPLHWIYGFVMERVIPKYEFSKETLTISRL